MNIYAFYMITYVLFNIKQFPTTNKKSISYMWVQKPTKLFGIKAHPK